MPTLTIEQSSLASTSNTALMVLAGFASSNGDARRQIAGGAFRINGVKVSDANAMVEINGDEAELRKGNNRKRLVVTR
jgi:tyrosyl-tRNA synthetase